MRSPNDLVNQAQHGRMQGIGQIGDAGIAALRRQGVLRQIVGADAEEIHRRRQPVGHDGRGGDLHHDANLQIGRRRRPQRGQFTLYLVQPAAHHRHLVIGRDHREHDAQTPARAGAQQGAQLRLDQVRPFGIEADGPRPQEGVVLMPQVDVGQFLVSAHIERARDQRPRPQRLEDGAVDFFLLRLRWRDVTVQIQELRAQQAHAFRAGLDGPPRIGHAANVRRHFDLNAIRRDGRFATGRFGPLARLKPGAPPCLPGRRHGRGRVDQHRAAVAIHHQARVGGQSQEPRAQSNHRGNTQRARQDGAVRRGAAPCGDQAQHFCPIQVGGVAWRQVISHQNGRRVQVKNRTRAGQGQLHLASHIAHVSRTRLEGRVIERGVGRRHRLDNVIPGRFRVESLVENGLLRRLQQSRVVEEEQVGVENGGLGAGALLQQARMRGFDLLARRLPGRLQALPFSGRVGDDAARHRRRQRLKATGRPDGNAGRNGHALQRGQAFLGRWLYGWRLKP